jgi:hypothetical protein
MGVRDWAQSWQMLVDVVRNHVLVVFHGLADELEAGGF